MQNKETMNEEAVLMVCLQLLKGEKEIKDYGFAVLNESVQVVEKILKKRKGKKINRTPIKICKPTASTFRKMTIAEFEKGELAKLRASKSDNG